jgi:hypothetical protein
MNLKNQFSVGVWAEAQASPKVDRKVGCNMRCMGKITRLMIQDESAQRMVNERQGLASWDKYREVKENKTDKNAWQSVTSLQ